MAEISEGTSLAGTTTYALSQQSDIRSVCIEIINTLDVKLSGGEHYLDHGVNSIPPLTTIRPHYREAVVFDKFPGTATGSAGVLTYTIDDEGKTRFALVFSVPFNYIHADNWFGLKWIDADLDINANFYNDLYYDDAWGNPGSYNDRKFGYAKNGRPVSLTKSDSFGEGAISRGLRASNQEICQTYGGYVLSAFMSNMGRSIIKLEVSRHVNDRLAK